MDNTPQDTPKPKADRTARILRYVIGTIIGLLALAAIWLGAAYASSPEAVRHPKQAHYHFRLQVVSDGKPVNFAENKFQTEFNKDMCTADLTKEPFHFHDNLNQFMHVHWSGLSGGLLLKHYGWNFTGGADDTLGYRFSSPLQPVKVGIHGKSLPTPPAGAKYYIYTGDATAHKERDWNDFLKQDLEAFFAGKTSGLLERLIPSAQAHGDDVSAATHHDEAELIRINQVLGNVVIFAQAQKPTDQQVKDRFNDLIDLPESSCGG
jgi:hypothetical protein